MKKLIICLMVCTIVVLLLSSCKKDIEVTSSTIQPNILTSKEEITSSNLSSNINSEVQEVPKNSGSKSSELKQEVDKKSLEYLLKNGTYSEYDCFYRFVDDKETNTTGNILILLRPEISSRTGFTKQIFNSCGVSNIKLVRDNGVIGKNKFITLECENKSMTALNETIAQLYKLKGVQSIEPDTWIELEKPLDEEYDIYAH